MTRLCRRCAPRAAAPTTTPAAAPLFTVIPSAPIAADALTGEQKRILAAGFFEHHVAAPDARFLGLRAGGAARRFAAGLVAQPAYEPFFVGCILANVLFQALADRTAPAFRAVQELTEACFTYVFSADIALRLLALGGGAFARSPWNALDVAVTALGWVAIFAPSAVPPISSLRTFKLLRLAEATPSLAGARLLLQAVAAAAPGLGAVLFLLFTLLFANLAPFPAGSSCAQLVGLCGGGLISGVITSTATQAVEISDYRWCIDAGWR